MTDVVSAAGRAPATVVSLAATGCDTAPTDDAGATDLVDEDAAVAVCAAESLAVSGRCVDGAGFAGGNNSCETAMTTSDRNRARKKRLSIQGTGSYPPGRKGRQRRMRLT